MNAPTVVNHSSSSETWKTRTAVTFFNRLSFAENLGHRTTPQSGSELDCAWARGTRSGKDPLSFYWVKTLPLKNETSTAWITFQFVARFLIDGFRALAQIAHGKGE